MHTFGTVTLFTAVGLAIYGFFAPSFGAIMFAAASLGLSVSAFVISNMNERRDQLDRIERG